MLFSSEEKRNEFDKNYALKRVLHNGIIDLNGLKRILDGHMVQI